MSSRDGNGDEAGWQPTAESRGEADDGSQSPSQDRDMGRSAQSEGAGGGAKGASRSTSNHSGAAAAVDGSGDDDASAAQSFRVKLYEMHPTHGRWEDLGVGRVFVEDNVNGPSELVVESEAEPGSMLVQVPLDASTSFRRVRSGIVSWVNEHTKVERALSFEVPALCHILYVRICEAQGLTVDHKFEPGDGEALAGDTSMASEEDGVNTENYVVPELPQPNTSNLNQVLEIVEEAAKQPTHRDGLAFALMDKNAGYLCSLLEVFGDLEDFDMVPELQTLFQIMRTILCLNSLDIFQVVLSDELFAAFAGVMEYDPDLPFRPMHREFFRKHCVFKQVIPIREEAILQRIHQTFRVQLLRDVLLPRALDDQALNSLTSLAFVNNTNVMTYMIREADFVDNLVDALHGRARLPDNEEDAAASGARSGRGPEEDADGDEVPEMLVPSKTVYSRERKDVLAFMLEMCNTAKAVMQTVRMKFFSVLADACDRILPVFEDVMSGHDASDSEVLTCLEIFGWLLTYKATPARMYIVTQKRHLPPPPTVPSAARARGPSMAPSDASDIDPAALVATAGTGAGAGAGAGDSGSGGGGYIRLTKSSSLLTRILWCMLDSDNVGIQSQAAEVLRLVVATETMTAGDQEQFLTCFYDRYIMWLTQPFIGPGAEADSTRESGPRKNAKRLVCEVLAFCVQLHAYRIKYFVLRNNVLYKVMSKVLKYREKHLVLTGIRFFRACVGLKDEFYNRYITKHNLMALVFDVFHRNGRKSNLLNSAVIELVDFIRHHGIVSLIRDIVERFPDLAKEVTYVKTFQQLKVKYDSYMGNTAASVDDDARDSSMGRRLAVEHETENPYFERDDDEPVIGPKLAISAPHAGTLGTSPTRSPGSPGSPPLPSPTGDVDEEFIERASLIGPSTPDDDDAGFVSLVRGKPAGKTSPKSPKFGLIRTTSPLGAGVGAGGGRGSPGGRNSPGGSGRGSPGRVSFSIGGGVSGRGRGRGRGRGGRVALRVGRKVNQPAPRVIAAPKLVPYDDDDDDDDEEEGAGEGKGGERGGGGNGGRPTNGVKGAANNGAGAGATTARAGAGAGAGGDAAASVGPSTAKEPAVTAGSAGAGAGGASTSSQVNGGASAALSGQVHGRPMPGECEANVDVMPHTSKKRRLSSASDVSMGAVSEQFSAAEPSS